MLYRSLLVGVFLCLLCAGGGRTEPAARPKSVLDDVPGLQRPVTFAESKIPLGELLRRVAKETGVSLYADRATADEPAAVVVTDMPAARLLNEVASFFDYRWAHEATSGGSRYRLYQDLKQKQNEQALRDAARADEETRLRIVLSAYAQVGQLPDAQYAEQRDALEQRPAGSPRPSVEEDRIYRGLRECGSSARRALARLLGRLTKQDWDALWQGRRLRMYSKPEAGERGLPPDVGQSLAAFRPSTSWEAEQRLVRNPENPAAAAAIRQIYERQDRLWTASDGVRVVVRLHRPSEMGRMFARERAATSLTAAVVPLLNDPPDGASGGLQPEQIRVWIWAANTQPKWGYDPPERLAALEQDPVFTSKQAFGVKTPPVEDRRGALTYGQIPALLPEIARTYGVSFLADSYWPTPVVPGSAFPTPAPPTAAGGGAPAPAPVPGPPLSLGALLTRLSGHYEGDINRITYNYYRWDRNDRLVLLRDRTWFFDRPKEIPMRLVARWDRMFEEQGCLTLDEYATGIASLTDDQWDSIAENGYSPVLPPGYNTIPSGEVDREVLRLFGMLTAAQRQRLERGAPIPWTEMNAAQRDLFLSVVEDQSLASVIPATRADLAGASLALAAEPHHLIRRKQGSRIRDRRVPREYDPGRYPELFGDARPDAIAQDSPAPAAPAAPAAPEAKPPPITYTRFPAASVSFVVRCGRTSPSVTTILVSGPSR